jgi:hypothetical protein
MGELYCYTMQLAMQLINRNQLINEVSYLLFFIAVSFSHVASRQALDMVAICHLISNLNIACST